MWVAEKPNSLLIKGSEFDVFWNEKNIDLLFENASIRGILFKEFASLKRVTLLSRIFSRLGRVREEVACKRGRGNLETTADIKGTVVLRKVRFIRFTKKSEGFLRLVKKDFLRLVLVTGLYL